ncbi:hypothetical protein BU26DRAFT_603152 [Trematosphaeria pertusa]|uniref:Uncharacterized protein n=1 Tax=Trematosphaeria pertusa TaxID=390896 RepID=A0A6A6IK72_9PLEO|nr:uncharacterized protein BU26DRAFT_603152 [Trematosphaeria pertusa]KAF2250577.1 hypothetical protein BU26DRAFT_603152 [Trematosphaeria pertusa]
MHRKTPTQKSWLLAIPTELRLQIYQHILADSSAFTISAAPLTVFGHRIRDTARAKEIAGLPLELVPLVRCGYDHTLLSITNPPEIALDNGLAHTKQGGEVLWPATMALLRTCQLTRHELMDCMQRRMRRDEEEEGLTLYVTYPYGLIVLKECYPELLKQASRVDISGCYASPQAKENVDPELQHSFGTVGMEVSSSRYVSERPRLEDPAPMRGEDASGRRLRLRLDPPLRQRSNKTPTLLHQPIASLTAATTAIASLARTLFPPFSSAPVKLTTRILYPGPASYPTVWSDDGSPIVRILQNTYGGEIDTKVFRGRHGSGVQMTVKPRPNGRMLTTGWGKLSGEWWQVDDWVAGDRGAEEEGE